MGSTSYKAKLEIGDRRVRLGISYSQQNEVVGADLAYLHNFKLSDTTSDGKPSIFYCKIESIRR